MFLKKRLLSAADDARLIKAIQLAESKTSGEIRVHIEKTCKGVTAIASLVSVRNCNCSVRDLNVADDCKN